MKLQAVLNIIVFKLGRSIENCCTRIIDVMTFFRGISHSAAIRQIVRYWRDPATCIEHPKFICLRWEIRFQFFFI